MQFRDLQKQYELAVDAEDPNAQDYKVAVYIENDDPVPVLLSGLFKNGYHRRGISIRSRAPVQYQYFHISSHVNFARQINKGTCIPGRSPRNRCCLAGPDRQIYLHGAAGGIFLKSLASQNSIPSSSI